ncbi:hypothetical protein NL436_27870, partial [Klebsiella pneumoniae]|nr:hypothetical protein [Klebsiella pneumoniae]
GRKLTWSYSEQNRTGDHIWWISDMSRFNADYPDYELSFDIRAIMRNLYENSREHKLEAAQ